MKKSPEQKESALGNISREIYIVNLTEQTHSLPLSR